MTVSERVREPAKEVDCTSSPAVMAAKGQLHHFPTLIEIKSQIPKHLYTANTTLSLLYVLRSVLMVAGLAFAAHQLLRVPSAWSDFVHLLPSTSDLVALNLNRTNAFQLLGWLTYWFLQGTIYWGIFVLGHDCGHSSFSPYSWLNELLGNILHGFILVPFESWRLTHRHHHKFTGNIDKDEVFYPTRESDSLTRSLRATPLMFGFAWFFYLLQGSRDNVVHFWPFHPLFKGRRVAVAISVAWWSAFMGLLYLASVRFGVMTVLFYHVIPVLVFGTWLVVTTFLHHNDPDAPWYDDSEWNYVKGNLSSIDRSYWPFNSLVHSIGTHQIHHLFPIIPHYNLDEATRHFRMAYPGLVRERRESVFISFWVNMFSYIMHGYVPPKVIVFTYRDGMERNYYGTQAASQ